MNLIIHNGFMSLGLSIKLNIHKHLYK